MFLFIFCYYTKFTCLYRKPQSNKQDAFEKFVKNLISHGHKISSVVRFRSHPTVNEAEVLYI